MTSTEIITIAAIFLGPALAAQAQKWIEKFKERHNRQLYIFCTLMHNRANTLNPEYVAALNLIDLDFF